MVDTDIGHGHLIRFFRWAPDRDLNPQYEGIPDVEKAGLIDIHPRPDNGEPCEGAIRFKSEMPGTENGWTVESWEPLTLSPSLLCRSCGDHGFIRKGKWVPA